MAWAYRAGTAANSGAGFNNTPGGGNSFTTSVTLGAAVSAGDRIIVLVHATQATASPAPTFSVRDNVNGSGRAYTEDRTQVNTGGTTGDYARLSIFSLANSAAGTPTITVTIQASPTSPASIFGGLIAAAFSGLLVTDPGTDGVASGFGSTSSGSSGATAATTAASELVVGAYSDTGWGTTVTPGSGFTVPTNGKHDNDGANWEGLLEYKDSSTSGTTQTATTSQGGATDWLLAAAVYKLAAGGPVYKNLTGAAAGVSTTTGALRRERALSGTAVGRAVTTGVVSKLGIKNLSGSAAGVATTTGTLRRIRALAGLAAGRASTVGAVSKAGALPVNYYTTTFPLTEDPISENGVWLSGRRDGTYWQDYKTSGGNAYGKQDGGPSSGALYDDSIACLKGTFTSNQKATGTVFNANTAPGYPEVELLLRYDISGNWARGYEILFSTNTNNNYCSIMRWQGVPGTTLGDFKNLSGDQFCAAPQTGDVLEATVIGNTIRAYKNGVLMATGVDTGAYGTPWTDGTPGIGHNYWNNGVVNSAAAATFGFSDFTAQSLSVYKDLSGSAAGVATAAATLRRERALVGAASGVSVTSGVLSKYGLHNLLANPSAGAAVTLATLTRERRLTGAAAGVATTSGVLSKKVLLGSVYWNVPPVGQFDAAGSLALRWEGDQFVTGTADPQVLFSTGQFNLGGA